MNMNSECPVCKRAIDRPWVEDHDGRLVPVDEVLIPGIMLHYHSDGSMTMTTKLTHETVNIIRRMRDDAFEIYRLGYAAGEWGEPVQEAFQRDVLRIKGSPVKIPSPD